MNLLFILAILSFGLHAWLLFTSFNNKKIKVTQYKWSHYTLWIAGALFSGLLFNEVGNNPSPVIHFFDTSFKKLIPLFAAFTISIIVHMIVKKWFLR